MKSKSALDFLVQSDSLNKSNHQSSNPIDTIDMAAEAAGLTREQQKTRSVRKEGGLSFITLNSGRRVMFESVYVPAEMLEIKTVVHEFNLRNQDAVTIEMCDDILPSIKKAGVKMPVLATRDSDDLLHIFDGSRRRFVAIKTGHGLHVDATREALTDDEISELSHITNLTKISSLYDRGRYYQLQREKYPDLSQNELAEHVGVSKSAMSYALQAFEVPLPIYRIFPSKTELGRTQTQVIYKIIQSLSDDELDALIAACKAREPFTDDKLAMAFIKEFGGKTTSPKAAEYTVIGKIKVTTKGKKLAIEVPDEATLEEIYRILQDKYL